MIRTVYLIRHAKSSWDDRRLDDFDRPLNKRGISDAPTMGRRLKLMGIVPDLMVSSPANRAIATARYLCKELGYPSDRIETDRELYQASWETICESVGGTPDTIRHLFIVAHNPGITEAAHALAQAGVSNVPTCGIVSIEFHAASWADVRPGSGRLVFFDYPKKGVD